MIGLLVLALAPAATEVAILPIGGQQITFDMMESLKTLDGDLRKNAPDGFHYQPADVTKSQVSGARTMGVACGLEDAPCLAKLAALADVDLVVSPIATPADADFSLKLVVVNRAGQTSAAEGVIAKSGQAAAAQALMQKALAGAKVAEAAAPPPDPAPPAQPEATAPAAAPQDAPPAADDKAASGPSLVFAGAAVAATGGVLALGTGIGALVLDASLATPEDYDDRVPKMTAGRALVVVCTVSSVVAVGGGALLGVALATE